MTNWQLRMTPEEVAAHNARVKPSRVHLADAKERNGKPLPKPIKDAPGKPVVRSEAVKATPIPDKPAKPSKYRNVKIEVEGIKFASKREARRYGELRLLERQGEIKDLSVHPKIPIVVNGHRIGNYIADFKYFSGKAWVWEDVKGVKTPVYRLKKKLVFALRGIGIREV